MLALGVWVSVQSLLRRSKRLGGGGRTDRGPVAVWGKVELNGPLLKSPFGEEALWHRCIQVWDRRAGLLLSPHTPGWAALWETIEWVAGLVFAAAVAALCILAAVRLL